jgi:aminoglycoside phosphotransferase (APT) family kinase protein
VTAVDAEMPVPQGIDTAAVGSWLEANVDDLAGPFSYELISGGHSNLTYRVSDAAGRQFVLRRQPLGHILPSAHDMGREFRIISGLAGSAVPVPTPLGLCEDPRVTGGNFYAMDFVDGWILRTPADTERDFPDLAERSPLAHSLIDVLANLHLLDPGDVGLGELGRHDGYIERQLRRWHRQWDDSKTRELPAIDEAHRLLSADVPPQQRVSIVHGDYRLDNVVSGFDAKVAAVLDWELCTLGDPLADLGAVLISWVEDGEDGSYHFGGTPSALPGFPTRAELTDRYAARSGLDLADVRYYIAFNYWKLACIGEGVYARYRAGAMGEGRDVSLPQMEAKVELLAELALATVREAS